MKRIMMTFIFVMMIGTLYACDDNESSSNKISVAELTDREQVILSTTSDNFFVFDFNVDSEYEEIAVWIEKYEFGKLVDGQFNHFTTEVDQNGIIIFTASKINNDKQEIFHVGIGNDSGTASTSNVEKNYLEDMLSVWGSFQDEQNLGEGEVVLATICYSDDEFGINSLPTDFYKDVEGHMNELEKYNVAYLLKAKLVE